jgi:hypothetical protein
VGLSPGGTANGEGGEGSPPPTRSWVKEPWKAGDGASGKKAAARASGPGLVSAPAARRDSMAERGGRDSAGRGGGRRASSPAAGTWRAAIGRRGRTQRTQVCRRRGKPLPPHPEEGSLLFSSLCWPPWGTRDAAAFGLEVKRVVGTHVDSPAPP